MTTFTGIDLFFGRDDGDDDRHVHVVDHYCIRMLRTYFFDLNCFE